MTSPDNTATVAAQRSAPRSPAELFTAFAWMALQGFGGVLGVVQRELVERRRWLSNDEFMEDWALAQVLPGPNVCNLALMFGGRHFGARGAMAALAGLLLLPSVLLLTLAVAWQGLGHQHPALAGALRGMGAVAVGVIAGAALKLLMALRSHRLGWPLAAAFAAAAFVAAAWLRWPLHITVLGMGGLACVLTWRRLDAAPRGGA